MNREQLIQKNKELFWDYITDNISDNLLVEKIFMYGDFSDVKDLFNTIGKDNIKKIFKDQLTTTNRINYEPRLINFFSLLLNIENEIPLGDIIAKAKGNSFVYRKG